MPIAFTDAKTASYENLVKLAARDALMGRPPLEGPLILRMRIRLSPPLSASRKKREAMLAGLERPTKKPDSDNVLKAILDGLNKVAFVDDVQVVDLRVLKVWAETPGCDVRLSPWAPEAEA